MQVYLEDQPGQCKAVPGMENILLGQLGKQVDLVGGIEVGHKLDRVGDKEVGPLEKQMDMVQYQKGK